MADRLRWGILGTGNIAKQFAAGVAGSERCALAGVGSRTAEAAQAFGEQFGVASCFADYEALLDCDDVDAVYVSLPNTMHRAWAEKALVAGKHVLCEKPFVVTAADAEAMFAAAEAADRVLIEAFMYRAHPQTAAVVAAVRRGDIGIPKLVRASFCYRSRQPAGNIRFDPQLAGGALMDVGCYCLDAAMLIADAAPTAAHAVGTIEGGIDTATAGVLDFAGPLSATFTCGLTTQADNCLHVCGDEGYLVVPLPWKPPVGAAGYMKSHATPPKQDGGGQRPPDEWVDVPDDRPLYGIEADAFAAVVQDGAEPFMPRAATLRLARLLEELRGQIGLKF
jgi:predicted dehydrogenase